MSWQLFFSFQNLPVGLSITEGVGVMLREGTGVRPDPQLISDCISLCEQACEVGTDEEGLAKMRCQKRVGSAPGPLL